MELDDTVQHKAQEAAGYVKKGIGEASDDERLQAEGRKDQRAGKLKQAGKKVKDAFTK